MVDVAFNQIPGNLRVPFMRFEINAGASPYQSIARLVLWGQMIAAGKAQPNAPVLMTGQEDGLFGLGSMLATMYKIARANAPFQEIWCVPVADAPSATPATGKIVISPTLAPIAASGSLVVYIGAVRVTIPVSTNLTAAQIAANLTAAINACVGMRMTAAVNATTTNEIDLTAINAGTIGNTIRIETRLNQDDGPLADTLCTITQPTGGAGDPDLSVALGEMGDDQWDWNVMPYATSSYLDEFKTWLDARWGPMSQTYGHLISAMAGSLGTVQAFLSARNNMHESVMPMYNSPQPVDLLAAAVGAVAAAHLQSAPELSRPLQTLALTGIRAPKMIADRFGVTARQTLYYCGGSGYDVARDGTVTIDRLITTYQRNAYGQPDMSWLDVNTIAQIMFGVRYIWQYMTSIYSRCALVDSNPNNLDEFVTVDDLRKGYIHAYKGLVALGVFENADMFAQLLVVVRNASDPNRVDAMLPTDAVNQLRVLANAVTSYLEYPTT